jgi:hypothetical protein
MQLQSPYAGHDYMMGDPNHKNQQENKIYGHAIPG